MRFVNWTQEMGDGCKPTEEIGMPSPLSVSLSPPAWGRSLGVFTWMRWKQASTLLDGPVRRNLCILPETTLWTSQGDETRFRNQRGRLRSRREREERGTGEERVRERARNPVSLQESRSASTVLRTRFRHQAQSCSLIHHYRVSGMRNSSGQ